MPDPGLKEERRREILMAALEAFAQQGYDKTSMDDIVQASGLSKGTLYWYFDSKAALFAAMVDMVFEDFSAMFEQVVQASRGLPPAARLRALIADTARAFDVPPEMLSLYMDFFVQAWHLDAVQQTLRTVYSQYVGVLAEILQQGIDSGAFRPVDARGMARALAGTWDGLLFQDLIIGEGEGFAAPLEQLAEVVLCGLVKGEAENG